MLYLEVCPKSGNSGKIINATVDDSELRRSTVEIGTLPYALQGFILVRWFAGFLPSTASCYTGPLSCNFHRADVWTQPVSIF